MPRSTALEDVLDTRGSVLFSLDVADYPHATRKVASWVLLGMGRLAKTFLGTAVHGSTPRALLLVDEVGALGHGFDPPVAVPENTVDLRLPQPNADIRSILVSTWSVWGLIARRSS